MFYKRIYLYAYTAVKGSAKMEKEKDIWARRWMADETAFSSVKRMFGEYMYHSNQVSQHGKRDGYESISA